MITGPFTFTDADGESWRITGTSTVCGSGYADIVRESDGARSVRPKAVLGPAGLSVPEDGSGAVGQHAPETDADVRGDDIGGDAGSSPASTSEAELPEVAFVPVAGRFVLVHVVEDEPDEAYVTSWDEWADAEAGCWPLEAGFRLIDTHARMRLLPGASTWEDDPNAPWLDS